MKQIIIAVIVSNIFFSASAQNNTTTSTSKWRFRADAYKPVSLATFSNVSVNGFHYPSNFGFSLGAERDLRIRKNTKLYHYGTLGFYNDVYFERVTTLATGLGMYRKIYKTIGTNFEMDIAYNRATSSHLSSILENGVWVSQVDKSIKTNRFAFGIGGNFEYSFEKNTKRKLPLAITLGYNLNVVTPLDKIAKIPVGLYHQPRLGLKWNFNFLYM
jgi:hypothetical protein